MKAFLVLPLVFALTAAVVVQPPNCIREEILCEFENEDHPAKECYAKMSPRIQEIVKKDCETYKGTDEFEVFQQNISIVCDAKGYPVAETNGICDLSFTTPPMDFVLCAFDDSDHPIHDCYQLMSPQIQKSLVADCTALGSTDEEEDFQKNIELLCETKKSMVQSLELEPSTPPLFFEPCALDDSGHPAHDCYNLMSSQIQKSLVADCLAAQDNDDALDDLAKNIEVVCEAKNSRIMPLDLPTTPFPLDFDMCDFADDNHPAHDCYSEMSSQIQKNVKADCVTYENSDEMESFADNIRLLCDAKGTPATAPTR